MKSHFCEIILNLGPWFRSRCHIKIFVLLALLAKLFSLAEPFVPFWQYEEHICEFFLNLNQCFRCHIKIQ